MKILIIGGNGQLGSDINLVLSKQGYLCTCVGSEQLDITSSNFEAYFKDKNFDYIINTSAYHNLELCEENKRNAVEVNSISLYKLSQICNLQDSILIHFSTDYVFDGYSKSPYLEIDTPNPLNVYGHTKLLGEKIIEYMCDKYYIIRTSGLYGKHPCRGKGKNFVDLMLHLAKTNKEIKVVDNEELCPTNTYLLSKQVFQMMHSNIPYGLYHAVSNGSCTWYKFAKEIFKIKDIAVNVIKAGPNDFPQKTPRPSFTALKNYNLDKINYNFMPTWKEGLKGYLN
jgi:dTDP-4-dehydrorhamnose reductase